MARQWATTALAVLAGGFGATAITALASSPSQTGTTTTVHVIEHPVTDTEFNTADATKATDAFGDILPFGNPLYDAANKVKVGRDQGNCFRIRAKANKLGRASWECAWTNVFTSGPYANSSVTVEGPYYDTGDSYLAITGGTGVFATARGQMLLHFRVKQNVYDFVFTTSS
jgi:allene oxide cyclase